MLLDRVGALERLRRNGLDPLPVYRPPASPPPDMLRLLIGKQAYFTHAANQDSAWLNALSPENRLWINREAAARRASRTARSCPSGAAPARSAFARG